MSPNVLTLFYTGGGSSGPPLEVYLAWRLSGRSDGAQISWLCFFPHLLCPIEATFQKKFLKIWKIAKNFFDRSDIKGSPLWKKNFEIFFSNFFAINHTFSIWIWILHVLSFLLMYITYTFIKIFEFSFFYYEFSVDYQLHSSASHSKNSHQKWPFLVPMDC